MAFLLPSAEALLGARGAYALRPFRAAAFFQHRLSGVRELRQRVRPYRAGSFSLNLSEGIRRAPRRGKRVDTKVSTLLTPTSFWEGLAQITDM